MSRFVPKTYRNYHTLRIILKTLLILLISAVILFISLFFGLKRYIVYRDDGLKLEIPFLMEEQPSPPS